MNKIDLQGQRFGKLVVIKDTGKRKRRTPIWLCHCDCGNLTEVRSYCLRGGVTKSCGCLRNRIGKANPTYKHGDFSFLYNGQNPIYTTWSGMKARCYNKKSKSYQHYGERGIKICPEWKNNYFLFKKWALANGYKLGLTIDRINNDGNYEPSNCRWITKSENTKNKWILYRKQVTSPDIGRESLASGEVAQSVERETENLCDD